MNAMALSPAEAKEAFDRHFGPEEDLCEELKGFLKDDPMFGETLRHPLVNLPCYHARLANFANSALARKREAAAEADRERRFEQAIFLHERPWRLQAFLERMWRMGSVARGRIMGRVWRDSEFPHVNLGQWLELWRNPDHAKHAMSSKERVKLDSLLRRAEKRELVLWRGTGSGGPAMRGLSWTTDREKAEWFASRLHGSPHVWEIRPGPERLLAYQGERGESEVIVNVTGLRGITRVEGVGV